MFRRAFALPVATVALAAPLVLTAAPAQADSETCVSKAEFHRIAKGDSIARVRNIFDVPGKQTYFASGDAEYDIPAYQSRRYKPCPKYSYVSVDFEREAGDTWRVTSKSAYWG